MSLSSWIKTNFTAGEVSPKAIGRVDIAKYENGAETMKNFLISPFGGAYRRPGTLFVAPVKTHSQFARIIPFIFNSDQTYVLEFNASKIRFYRNQAPILETAVNISGITQANPGVVTANSHGYSNGDEVYISGVVGMTQVNGRRFIVANVATNTFELTDRDTAANINTTSYTAWASGGTVQRVYQIASPYAAADLPDLKFAQINDLMYIVHPDYQPRQLIRSGHASWSIGTVTFENGPYLPRTESTRTMTPGSDSPGTGVTLTASSAFFTSDMVGGLIRVKSGWCRITGFTSSTVVTVTIVTALATGPAATTDWEIGAWSDEFGWPAAITFYEQRAAYAGTYEQPQTVWLSVPEDFENFEPGSNADDALNYTIATEKVNAITWLSAEQVLLAGTSGGVFSIYSGSQNEALTPANVTVKRQANNASDSITPEKIGNLTYFVQRGGLKLRELGYDFQSNSYKASDITLLSDHITEGGITEMAFQDNPDSILWCVLGSGKIATLTREVNEQVAGWAVQETDGLFESICCIPGTDYDEVWFVVKRTINGNTRRYIEVLQNSNFGDQEDAFFVDCAKRFAAAATISSPNIVDDSSNAHSMSAEGGATLNASIKKFGTSSLELDGDGDYLSLPHHADYNFQDQNFTLDFQIRFDTIGSDSIGILAHWLETGDLRGWRIFYEPSTHRLCFNYSTDGTSATFVGFYFPWAPAEDQFYHVEINRSGSVVRAFVDGAQIGTGKTIGTSSIFDANTPLLVGALNESGTIQNELDGFIDELRISKGIARHGEASATDGLKDSSSYNRTLTLHGNAALYTADFAFGDGCMSLDGSGDYLSAAGAAEFNLGTGAFVAECFFKLSALTSGWLICIGDPNSGGAGLYFNSSGTPTIEFVRNGTTVNSYPAGIGGRTTFTTGIWYHAFIKRNSQNSYTTGAAKASDTHGQTYDTTVVGVVSVDGSSAGLTIGAQSGGGGGYINGYIDEIRISNTTIHGTTYDVPTYEFTEDTTTLLLAHFEKYRGSFTAPTGAYTEDVYTKLLSHFNGETTYVAESAMSGFEHLEAKSVSIYADSERQSNKTVGSGVFTLETAAVEAVIGLSYESRIKLLRPEVGAATGSSQGKHKRITNSTLRVNDSLDMSVGNDEIQYPTDFRTAGDNPPDLDDEDITPMRSDDFEIMMPGGWNKAAQPVIVNSYPTPLHVLCVISQLETED